jgi:hypothetical protein
MVEGSRDVYVQVAKKICICWTEKSILSKKLFTKINPFEFV